MPCFQCIKLHRGGPRRTQVSPPMSWMYFSKNPGPRGRRRRGRTKQSPETFSFRGTFKDDRCGIVKQKRGKLKRTWEITIYEQHETEITFVSMKKQIRLIQYTLRNTCWTWENITAVPSLPLHTASFFISLSTDNVNIDKQFGLPL